MEIKNKKVIFYIVIAVAIFSLLLFIPQIRELLFSAGDKLFNRELNHDFWHKKILKLEVLFLLLFSSCLFFLKLRRFFIQNDISIYDNCLNQLKKMDDFQFLHMSALAVYIFILCAIHFCIVPSGDDLTYFSQILREKTLFEFLTFQYNNWSSRSIIEAVLVNCFKLNFGIWRFFDVLAFIVISESFIYLSFNKSIKALLVYPVLLCFTDFNSLQSAGWGATTVNYLWPLACAMPHFIIVKQIFEEKKLSFLKTASSVPFFLFAVNQEQVAALLLGLNVSFLIFRILKNKKVQIDVIYFGINILISSLSVVYIMTCPGNDIRYTEAIRTCFPTYESLLLINKIQIGLLTIFTYYFTLKANLVILPLCLILTLEFYRKKKINFIFQIILDIFIVICGFFKKTSVFLFSNNKIAGYSKFNNIEITIETIILIFFALVLLFQVYRAFEQKLKGATNVYLLLAGFCSAIITIFSPTVYVSGSRCYLFFSAIIFYVTFNLMNQYTSTHKE